MCNKFTRSDLWGSKLQNCHEGACPQNSIARCASPCIFPSPPPSLDNVLNDPQYACSTIALFPGLPPQASAVFRTVGRKAEDERLGKRVAVETNLHSKPHTMTVPNRALQFLARTPLPHSIQSTLTITLRRGSREIFPKNQLHFEQAPFVGCASCGDRVVMQGQCYVTVVQFKGQGCISAYMAWKVHSVYCVLGSTAQTCLSVVYSSDNLLSRPTVMFIVLQFVIYKLTGINLSQWTVYYSTLAFGGQYCIKYWFYTNL